MAVRWALLVGGKGSGMSSLAGRVVAALRERGVAVAGVIQEAIEAEGECVAVRIRRIGRDQRATLARRGETARDPNEQAFCSFVFDNQAFAAARSWLAADAPGAAVLVIDEVSKLEAVRGGHHQAVARALGGPALVVLVVRAEELFAVMECFGLDEPVAALDTAEGEAIAPFVDAIVASLAAEGIGG